MLKEIRRKVMQIANRLVKRGQVRACAMETAWRLVKAHALSTRVAGTSFDNRQNVLELIAKYNPADVTVELVRDRSNAFDSNAVAVTAAIKGKVSAVIGYLPKAVAAVVAVLMDKGIAVLSDTLSIVGGCADRENYGARIIVKI